MAGVTGGFGVSPTGVLTVAVSVFVSPDVLPVIVAVIVEDAPNETLPAVTVAESPSAEGVML